MKSWITKSGILIRLIKASNKNLYLVSFNQKNILVDSSRQKIWPQLRRSISEGIQNENLDYLFLTNAHYENVENAGMIKKDFGSLIIADKREEPYLKNGSTPPAKGTNTLSRFFSAAYNRILASNKYHPVNSDISIDNQSAIKTEEGPVTIMRTPGPSAGSLSLILDREIAIVGDTFYKYMPGKIFPLYAYNVSEMLNSWKKLLDTGCKEFLPGHGPSVKREEIIRSLSKRKNKRKSQPVLKMQNSELISQTKFKKQDERLIS